MSRFLHAYLEAAAMPPKNNLWNPWFYNNSDQSFVSKR